MKGYFAPSRTLSVGLVAILPLLAAYEIGILLTGARVQNHAGLLVKRMILHLGFGAYAGLTAAVSLGFIVALVAKHKGPERDFRGYPLILLEGALLGAVLGPLVTRLQGSLGALAASPAAVGTGLRALLFMGAGVWEELVFRLLLLGGLRWICVKVVRGNDAIFTLLALLFSSAAFALFHHAGAMAEPFRPDAFVFRLLAGGALGLLFLVRGLGVCVYTHAFYNVGLLVFWSERAG